ncbi:hypothetical protein [Aquibacillus sediminis]|uniref:hypothetical protein n=1 Tax=Aquibacillus sediminis TaxID=2574734 RepID=UPI0014866AF1|nr:hypothetical protein [Aquibacillus sediminis]
MKNFFEGLSNEEQRDYKRLFTQFINEEDFNIKKKYIPYLVMLKIKGLNAIQSSREE